MSSRVLLGSLDNSAESDIRSRSVSICLGGGFRAMFRGGMTNSLLVALCADALCVDICPGYIDVGTG